MKPEIHPSAMPRLSVCHASRIPPQIKVVDEGGPEARRGSAAHFVIHQTLMGAKESVAVGTTAESFSDIPLPEIQSMLTDWRDLYAKMKLSWDGKSKWQCEDRRIVDYGDFAVNMQIDMHGRNSDSHLTIIDWKTGQGVTDPWQQVRTYAAALAKDEKYSGKVVCYVAYIDLGHYDTRTYEPDDLAKVEGEIREILASDKYNPQPDVCRYCPRKAECPALELERKEATSAFLEERQPGELQQDQALRLYTQGKVLRSALDAWDTCFKEWLGSHGPLDLGNGKEVISQEQHRETITGVSLGYLKAEGLPEDKLLDAMTISKAAIEKIAGKKQAKEIINGLKKHEYLKEGFPYTVVKERRKGKDDGDGA